jgi:tRNA threonylcarbamoyladenosine biosynthesis protein TsaB
VKTLVIENSTDQGTLAVADDGEILVRRHFARSGEMAGAIQEIFLAVGAPDEIVVGIGPGSYTGLRVASATAIGIQAALGCAASGCPSVLGYPAGVYHVLGDARLGAIFFASVQHQRVTRGPELLPVEEFRKLRALLGEAALFAVGPVPGCDDVQIVRPAAEYLVGCRDSFVPSLEPLYLKEPHITVKRKEGRRGNGA